MEAESRGDPGLIAARTSSKRMRPPRPRATSESWTFVAPGGGENVRAIWLQSEDPGAGSDISSRSTAPLRDAIQVAFKAGRMPGESDRAHAVTSIADDAATVRLSW